MTITGSKIEKNNHRQILMDKLMVDQYKCIAITQTIILMLT